MLILYLTPAVYDHSYICPRCREVFLIFQDPCSRGRWNPEVKYTFLFLHCSIYYYKNLLKITSQAASPVFHGNSFYFLGSPLNALVIFWSMPFKFSGKRKKRGNSKLYYCSFSRGKALTQAHWGIKMHLRMAESFLSLRVSLLAGRFMERGARNVIHRASDSASGLGWMCLS